MAVATYYGEDWSVTFEARAVREDYGVSGSPVWYSYEDAEIIAFELFGCDMPLDTLPKNVKDALLDYADECEDWE